ncbi:hypothetical protein D3C76_1547660 [compost metagenome]
MFEHVLQLLENVQVTETQDADAFMLEKAGTLLIVFAGGIEGVLAAIEFYCQFQVGAVEVQDVGRAGKLAAEFQVEQLASSQLLP